MTINRYYKGTRLQAAPSSDGLRHGPVNVLWPGCLHPIYITTSLYSAMCWVDAYRDGQQWAVEAARDTRASP